MRREKMPKKNSILYPLVTNFKNLLLILVAGFLNAQQTPQALVTKMGRGISLGNVLSAPSEGNWAGAATEQYFIDVANAGFTNVRIPMDFFGTRTTGSTSSFSSSANTNTTVDRSQFQVSAAYLDRLEQVIAWGLNQGLVIVLDFHGATLKSEFIYTFNSSESSYTHPTSAKRAADLAKFYAIWEQIADRFKNYSDNLIFEVINEPYFHISASEMDEINAEVISIVRASGGNNSIRKIVITGGSQNSFRAITSIGNQIINSDNYLIATFHYYLPFSFTKSSDHRYDDNNWGTNQDKNEVDANFQTVADWANQFSPPVAVYLGEFGADNAYGYSYQTGDLHKVTANNSPNGNGYADGGPDLNSRYEYHAYLANAAISRDFSFSAWDAGGEASKSIHLRKDSGLTVYDIDYFCVDSYDPKSTTISTVNETSLWVDDIKDALLGVEKTCNDNVVLKNMDFECGFDNNWSLYRQPNNDDKAVLEDATCSGSFSGVSAAKITVLQSGSIGSVILRNAQISNDGSLNNNRYTFSVYGKGSSPDLTFKMRVKYILNGSQYTGSQEKTLQTSYPQTPYTFSFDVPDGTTEIQFQLLCGEDRGTYYFDNFSATEETLSKKKLSQKINIYPNPVSNKLYIEKDVSVDAVSLYDINGKKIKSWKGQKNEYDLSFLLNGIYFIEIVAKNNLFCTKSIIKG
ncbi:MAG: Endoglucanase H [Flavobacteriales bacterium]|nr:MAG: Endoglucanase H [Flavobacteriales bacterium]